MDCSSRVCVGHCLVVLHLAHSRHHHLSDPESEDASSALPLVLHHVHRLHRVQLLPDLLDDRRDRRHFRNSRGRHGPHHSLLGILFARGHRLHYHHSTRWGRVDEENEEKSFNFVYSLFQAVAELECPIHSDRTQWRFYSLWEFPG